MNASSVAQINVLRSSFKASMSRALKSKAFALAMLFLGFIALCYVFSALAQLCVLVFGETLGLLVYFIVSFGLIFAVEAYEKRTRARRF